MTRPSNTFIFVDMDETMIHSYYAQTELSAKTKSDLDRSYKQEVEYFGLGENEYYITYLRPGTREFLKWARERFGRQNVLIATAAIHEYAVAINKVLSLGFEEHQIYSRDRIYQKGHIFYKSGKYFLVDDRDYWEHREGRFNKLRFLRKLPESQLINVPLYIPDYEDEHDVFESVKKEIIENL